MIALANGYGLLVFDSRLLFLQLYEVFNAYIEHTCRKGALRQVYAAHLFYFHRQMSVSPYSVNLIK